MSDQEKEPLFKVLMNGQSCHGGSLAWPLPIKNADDSWTPGEWVEVKGKLRLCKNGLHLTSQPMGWYIDASTVYSAEYDGEIVGDPGSDKVCVRRARLVAEAVWSDHGVYHEGDHALFDNASARLSGNASATLLDNASATLSGNASATLFDNASATLSGNASATLFDNASARLSGNASARLSGNASARLSGNASATSDHWHSPSAVVALEALAAHIDRRGGKLVLRSAAATATAS